MNKETDLQINQEIRIRLLEKICEGIENKFQHVENRFQHFENKFQHFENKLDNQFKWTIGIIITTFIGMIIAKLI